MAPTASNHESEDERDGRNRAGTDSKLLRIGYLVTAFTLFVIGGWASLAPIDGAALATGVVQIEGKRKAVQHLEGGIISEIRVANGDFVEAGTPLLTLDAARYKADRDILQGRLFNAEAKLQRLKGELNDEPELQFSNGLRSAASTDPRAENAMSSESALFNARLADRVGEEAVVESQRLGLLEVAKSREAVLASLNDEISDLSALLSEGYVDKQRLRELERTRSETLGQLTDIEVSIEEAKLTILQMRKRFKTNIVDELAKTQELLYDLKQEFLAAEDRVVRATVRAPVAGTVLALSTNTVGAVIRPGDTLMEIVPDAGKFIVEARISPMDIDRVSIGQPAEIRFSVFKDAYMISGFLQKLSADRLIDQASDVPYYEAVVILDQADLYLLDGMALVPGMPAEVLVKTGQRTMLGYVTSPLKRMFSQSLIEE